MSKTKILVVDDDPNLLSVLKKVLTAKGGTEVHTESDSRRAVQTTGKFCPDIVILDVDMPGMDGGEVAHALRGNALTKDTPIIFLTSLSTRADARARQDADMEEYMVAKPVDATTLMWHIEKRLRGKSLPPTQ